ncbi:hypothetical protein FACS1894121_0550 [Bacteroidia bacterium]|nr:hypothetical protein FACS1894121_0550 [Bacteroidia bacterium]
MKLNKLFLSFLACVVLSTNVSAQITPTGGRVYVKENGTGNGSSWATATGDLQAAINASAAGGQVWVAKGTYKPTHTANNWTIASPTGVNTDANDRNNAFVLKRGESSKKK